MKCYVVTNVNLGWDCVVDVFADEEVARKEYPDEDSYVIHEQNINMTSIDDYEKDDIYETHEPILDSLFIARMTKEKFEEIISSGVTKTSISSNTYSYDCKELIELLESEGFKITYTGKTGYTMEKIV